jgi:hypothetical protein
MRLELWVKDNIFNLMVLLKIEASIIDEEKELQTKLQIKIKIIL